MKTRTERAFCQDFPCVSYFCHAIGGCLPPSSPHSLSQSDLVLEQDALAFYSGFRVLMKFIIFMKIMKIQLFMNGMAFIDSFLCLKGFPSVIASNEFFDNFMFSPFFRYVRIFFIGPAQGRKY